MRGVRMFLPVIATVILDLVAAEVLEDPSRLRGRSGRSCPVAPRMRPPTPGYDSVGLLGVVLGERVDELIPCRQRRGHSVRSRISSTRVAGVGLVHFRVSLFLG